MKLIAPVRTRRLPPGPARAALPRPAVAPAPALAAGVAVAVGLAVALAAASPAAAQTNNVPNALQGFTTNRDQPIRIDANELEVRDKDKAAVFTGNVVVTQGDTTLRCNELVVFYDGKNPAEAAGAAPAAEAAARPAVKPGANGGPPPAQPATTAGSAEAGGPMGSSSIRRLEMNGGVVVTTKEQSATGDQGVFEAKTNIITLTGKPVVLTQGPNVIRGRKLTVDLVSGTSRFEGGRIQSLIVPNSMKEGAEPGATPAKPKP
ncbi:LptA/OstA family protein [Ancylobacter lacus]|uniref:LptA/OstA family protein n=1 Tax=Ancylobacter lacus TaxID=2579970 RepID=UPI001BCD33D2|nr:LptA/OstA family protein [Ancylobacter lacus]MBS7540396.1 organic solvent tolerance protein OstA [Ancylobacter lacus]